MVNINTSHYFIPPENYFWHWSKDGSAFDWSHGQTLAFTKEVLAILETLADQGGIPPLGTLLLIHSAASGNTKQFEKARDQMIKENAEAFSSAESKTLIAASTHSLSKIAQLPEELRFGTRAKVKLCLALFNRTTWSHTEEKAQLLIEDFRSQLPTLWIDQEPPISFQQRLLRDTSALIKVTAGLDSEGLENLIRTGIEPPEIADPEFVEFEDDSEDHRNLIERLADSGPELSALASIARQVIGLIALPLPATKTNELPIGGVADIVNRGTPDKLLTTELAWGDTILASRLAQNEALYYHRETPPQNTPSERIILLDHGLRYWGLLRLFALATHLGLKNHNASPRTVEVTNLIATQDSCETFHLETPNDVRAALAKLPTHLDLAPALTDLSSQISDKDTKQGISDIFLITSTTALADSVTSASLHQLTAEVRDKGGRLYVIEVTNEGNLTLSEHRARGVRKLQEGILDLDELLPSKKQSLPSEKPKEKLTRPSLEKLTGSKFYNHYPPPLLLPANPLIGVGVTPERDPTSLVGISNNAHVMKWQASSQQAIELSQKLPGRHHWIGLDESQTVWVAASGDSVGDAPKVFRIQSDGKAKEIVIEKPSQSFPIRAVFAGNHVIFIYSNFAEAMSLESGNRIDTLQSNEKNFTKLTLAIIDGKIAITSLPLPVHYATHIQRYPITNHTNEPFVPRKIKVESNGWLVLESTPNSFILNPEQMVFGEGYHSKKVKASKNEHKFLNFEETASHRFENEPPLLQAISPKGPIFTYDPRGFLHLTNGSSSWTITINNSPISIWKSRNSDDLRPATREDFLTFLKKLSRTLNP
jgi:hypothetical protein